MEPRLQDTSRVLEALSPALTAELDRIVNETRQALEAEFESRLQNAVSQAEASAREIGATELQKAVDEARESQRAQLTDELQTQFSAKFEDAVQKLKAEFEENSGKANADWNIERTRLQGEIAQWRAFAEAESKLTDATSQPEILLRWIKIAEPFASSIAVYTAKADGLALWRSRGSAVFPEIISKQTTDPESYFRHIVVRGKTVAAVCAAHPYRAQALDFLITTLERAIELFGLRLRAPAVRVPAETASIS